MLMRWQQVGVRQVAEGQFPLRPDSGPQTRRCAVPPLTELPSLSFIRWREAPLASGPSIMTSSPACTPAGGGCRWTHPCLPAIARPSAPSVGDMHAGLRGGLCPPAAAASTTDTTAAFSVGKDCAGVATACVAFCHVQGWTVYASLQPGWSACIASEVQCSIWPSCLRYGGILSASKCQWLKGGRTQCIRAAWGVSISGLFPFRSLHIVFNLC